MAEKNPLMPQRKVVMGAVTGAATVVLMAILRDGFGYEPSADVASSVTTLLSFAAAYATPSRRGGGDGDQGEQE